MSSSRMQERPSTVPMMFMTSDSPGRSRRLSTMASGALSSRFASTRAPTMSAMASSAVNALASEVE